MKVSTEELFGLITVRSQIAGRDAEVRIRTGGKGSQGGGGKSRRTNAMTTEEDDLFQDGIVRAGGYGLSRGPANGGARITAREKRRGTSSRVAWLMLEAAHVKAMTGVCRFYERRD